MVLHEVGEDVLVFGMDHYLLEGRNYLVELEVFGRGGDVCLDEGVL